MDVPPKTPHPVQKYTPPAVVPSVGASSKEMVMYRHGSMVDPKAKNLADMVNDSISYEIIESMLYSDMAVQAKNMGYEGHYLKFLRKAEDEFLERLHWITYLDEIFDEYPVICVNYESPIEFHNLNEIYTCLLEYYRFASARFHIMLGMAHDSKIYYRMSDIHNALEKTTHTAEQIAKMLDYCSKHDWNADVVRQKDMEFYYEYRKIRR